MLTLKEILKSDPKSIPIGEYERVFSFINLIRIPDNDAEKKQAYLQAYRFHIFLYYSWTPVAASFLVYYFSRIIPDGGYISQRIDVILYAFWHWGFPEGEHLSYTRACGATSLSWAAWLVWRLYRDTTDRGVFLREDVQEAFPKLLQLALFVLLGSLFFFVFSLLGPFGASSLAVPSAHDSVYVYAFKKCAMISSGYWLLGFSSLLLSTGIRWAYQQR